MEPLNELIGLFQKELGSSQGLGAEESARLKVLMQDPALVEKFSDWQAGQASAEPGHSLSAGDWTRLDKAVLKGYRHAVKAWWARPGFWLAAGSLGVLAAGMYLALCGTAPEAAATKVKETVQEEEKGFRLVDAPRPETERPRPAIKPATPARALTGLPPKMPTAKVIKVVVQRKIAGMVRVEVKDSLGQVLRHLYHGNLNQGRWTLEWDGRDDSGNHVSAGHYRVEVSSDAGIQSKEVEVFGKSSR